MAKAAGVILGLVVLVWAAALALAGEGDGRTVQRLREPGRAVHAAPR